MLEENRRRLERALNNGSMETVGKIVVETLRSGEISIEEFAQKNDISKPTMFRIVKTGRIPKSYTFWKILNGMNVQLLVTEKDSTNNKNSEKELKIACR